MAKWVVAARKADFKALSEKLNIDQVLVRILRNRELTTIEEMNLFLYGSEEALHDPFLLNDMDKAVDLIVSAINQGKKLRIIGDYDVDGVTSTFILVKGLSSLGAKVDYAIPDRVKDGYGINEHLIECAKNDAIDLIITCDNGIAAFDALNKAKEYGIDCIVTDHHEVPYSEHNGEIVYNYPNACAIINPKRHDSTYPFTGICGAMVAYKLITALSTRLSLDGEVMKELREMAGLGTVCDIMELTDENRVIVKKALWDMNNSRNIGIRALKSVCELEDKKITSYHLGFIFGPCINSTGRLDSASLSLSLLLEDDFESAVLKASELRRLNELRKSLTEDGVKEAFEQIDTGKYDDKKVVVIYLKNLHESIAGIVASRVKERIYKPVFIITKGEDCLKGSGRSIPGYDMYKGLCQVSDTLLKFGGHKMAAGISLREDNIEEFDRLLNENCTLDPEAFIPKITIDVPMPLYYVSEGLVEELTILEPFGMGNPKPVFADKKLRFISARVMGKNADMAKFKVTDDNNTGIYELVLFGGLDKMKSVMEEKYGVAEVKKLFSGANCEDSVIRMNIIYYPDINEYRGKRSLQFVIQDYM